MSARAIGSATISFGLVTIPVKLYSSGQSGAGVSFNMLHGKCGSRLKQQYICSKENVVVERTETVKGYEFAKDQYVIFTDEELKALEEQATKAIEITEFVPLSRVDPVYFERAYYLGPDKGAERSYRLLAEAMRQTGRTALAKYAARGKQYLVLLRANDDGLVMQELRYADEVKPFAEVEVPEGEVKEAELKLARQLIDQIASDEFAPEKYEDDVKKRVLALIDQKVKGEQVTAAPAPAPRGQIIDLMEALKASLAESESSASTKPPQSGERKPPKRAARREEAEEKAQPSGRRGKAKG